MSGSSESGSETVEELARRHPELVTVATMGWAAKGIVYLLLGVLAARVALGGLRDGGTEGDGGGESGEVSQSGAISEIADTTFGRPLLFLVAVGLGLYVVWRLASVLLPAEGGLKTWATRAAYLVSAVVYATLAWSAVSIARHGGGADDGESEDARIERVTQAVLERTGGRWLVGIAGVAIVAVGVFFVARGVRASFREELEPGSVGPVGHEAIVVLGRVGWVGRGLMMGLIGWFVVNAAVRFDAEEAQGLDGALRDTTATTLGAALAGVVAVSLIAFGVFCVVSAPRQRLEGVD